MSLGLVLEKTAASEELLVSKESGVGVDGGALVTAVTSGPSSLKQQGGLGETKMYLFQILCHPHFHAEQLIYLWALSQLR